MYILGRLLPLLMGKFIPKEDTRWENYLVLLHITDYLLAPSIHPDEVAHLKALIEDHHSTFAKLYPEASVIPKMHYMVHMPRLILQ